MNTDDNDVDMDEVEKARIKKKICWWEKVSRSGEKNYWLCIIIINFVFSSLMLVSLKKYIREMYLFLYEPLMRVFLLDSGGLENWTFS